MMPRDHDVKLLMFARRSSLQQLETLADCLRRCWHKRSVDLVHPYPFAHWVCNDGRELLVDSAYNPIWQRSPEGYVTVADPTEWIEGIAHRDVLFDKHKPFYQQYAGMKRLRTVLVRWNYIKWSSKHDPESEWNKFKQRKPSD